MRIAVVANNLRVAGGASVGRNIVATLPVVAPMHDYLFIVPRRSGYELNTDTANAEVVAVDTRSAPGIAFEVLHRVPSMLRRFAPNLVWTLGNLPVRHPPGRQALLVHNPHLFYPRQYYSRELLGYAEKERIMASYLRHSLKYVDLVFCQTQTAATRFQERYGHSRVAVMPNAVSTAITLPKNAATPPSRLAPFSDRFKLFALTKYYAHKNLELILEAYARHGGDLLADTVCFLTVDPSDHPLARVLLRRIARETDSDQVVNLGPLPQQSLGDYFGWMDVLVQPTTLESFSATYLEAMAFGVPILTSDLDFAREVCGSAAEYFDPSDPTALARGVKMLKDDAALRDVLVREGRRQLDAVEADWPAVVAGALDVLNVPRL